ncbi:NAD(P)/FAD-dependent oxidoreductase [Arthrobacter pigmenti]
MSTAEHIVVIGNGHAGVQFVDSLRNAGYSGQLTMIGEETSLPYQRPPLSKEFLDHGTTGPEPLPLRAEDFFARDNVSSITGSPAVRIDRIAQQVELADGRRIGYSSLVLCTGARNRQLNIPGSELSGVHGLRSLTDAQQLHSALATARDVVVVGGGFIGLEFASAACSRGLNVSVLEFADRPMARVLSRTMSEFFATSHQREGVNLRLGEGIAAFEGRNGAVSGAVSDTGNVYPADLVLTGIGVAPRTELAAEAGLEISNGIAVDGSLRTSDANIYAIGDCASYPNRHAGGSTRLESVQNATDHAKHLANVLTGNATDAFDQVPWFWSHQCGNKLQIAGLVQADDETVVRGDPGTSKFSTFCFRDGVLAAVESVNQPADHMAARRMLANGHRLTPAQAADQEFDIKTYSKHPAPALVP